MFTIKDKADRGTLSDTSAGAAVYSPLLLRFIYDHLVLGLYMALAWCCPTRSILLPFFQAHASPARRVLDIGVGTGYFPARATLPNVNELVLVDLNPHCLDEAGGRARKAHPGLAVRTAKGDFLARRGLQAAEVTRGGEKFDAISVMLLLHCLPGPTARKAAALVRVGRQLLEAERGVLFGATILGKGVEQNAFGRFLMWWHNAVGVFDNWGDDVEGFVGPLEEAFETVRWRVVGRVLLFEARGVRRVA
ncbi:uncharacterized protein K452DRAFT_279123 [Aplosporella prunicola CBS 121167]|uniref:Methyltransferase domain-containing protein n=1 Tax=Aplosporella prunicola CBS 121167 TaxID=1176127 RepID=A0A6A6AZB1_9PEZI|nr:uncharacterized protein K452DRAFT_279123 [Aplosporella prunicola CBS 121167]KAF2137120.1 hypothetical protein K452DRAFT_279123 [Aplosporella prunicola CBS 121167]